MDEVKELKFILRKLEIIVDRLDLIAKQSCNHSFKPDDIYGPRDNGERYYKCIKCGIDQSQYHEIDRLGKNIGGDRERQLRLSLKLTIKQAYEYIFRNESYFLD